MTKDKLLELHKANSEEACRLMEKKNADYAAGSDPFRNFRRHGLIGILVRLNDKLARLESFTETGTLLVKEESVHDTVLDIINYAVLFEGYVQESRHEFVHAKPHDKPFEHGS